MMGRRQSNCVTTLSGFSSLDASITVRISENLEFWIELVKHGSCDSEYEQRVRSYLEESRNATGPPDLFDIHNLENLVLI
jgi:hypothetical protein